MGFILGFELHYYSHFFAFVQKKKKKIAQAGKPGQAIGFRPSAAGTSPDVTC
jgi:hypothetical protein